MRDSLRPRCLFFKNIEVINATGWTDLKVSSVPGIGLIWDSKLEVVEVIMSLNLIPR